MSKSYEQITAQIEKLQREAETMRQREIADVVKQMREAIDQYGLTAEDLGFVNRRGRKPGNAPTTRMRRTTSGRQTTSGRIRYRDTQGNEWTGHGRRPQWFLNAIESGKTPDDLAV